jgi:hypothetical protein
MDALLAEIEGRYLDVFEGAFSHEFDTATSSDVPADKKPRSGGKECMT